MRCLAHEWNKVGRCWHVSTDIGDRARLLELADQLGLDVAPELRRFARSAQAEDAHRAGLYPFQVTGVDWLSKRQRALLADEMGLGKTVEVSRIPPEKCRSNRHRTKNCVARLGARMSQVETYLTPVITRGLTQPPTPGTLLIMNYEMLPAELERSDQIPPEHCERWRNCILIVDESALRQTPDDESQQTNRWSRPALWPHMGSDRNAVTQPPARSLGCAIRTRATAGRVPILGTVYGVV